MGLGRSRAITIILKLSCHVSLYYSEVSTKPCCVSLLIKPRIQGTGIRFYGQTGDGGALLFMSVDGSDWFSPVSLNGTSDGTKQIWNTTGLEDGDHQVLAITNPQNGGNSIWIDHVE